jgi:hypothetical protein
MPADREKPVYAKYIEHVPPDTTAAIFWLKNRDPQHWRDSQLLEHVLGKYIISDQPMTEEQWAKERATVIDADTPAIPSTEALSEKPFFRSSGGWSSRQSTRALLCHRRINVQHEWINVGTKLGNNERYAMAP